MHEQIIEASEHLRNCWDCGLIVQQPSTPEDNGSDDWQVEDESDDDLQWRRRGCGEEAEKFCILCTHFYIQSTNIGLPESPFFHNYHIWPWAFGPMGYPWAGQALCKSLHKPRPADHWF